MIFSDGVLVMVSRRSGRGISKDKFRDLFYIDTSISGIIWGQSENSVVILLSGYSFVSLRHETMASITDSIS